jgi:hypothetical protein
MKKPRLQAEPAYEDGHRIARDLLERITELLQDMPAPGDDEHPIDWTHVGSINEVNRRLSSVVAFLDGSES